MFGQLIDHDMLFPQAQRLLEIVPQTCDVPADLPDARLLEVPAALGEVVDGELLGRGAVDVVGEEDGRGYR